MNTNDASDISLDVRYEALRGMTEEETFPYFADPIENISPKI